MTPYTELNKNNIKEITAGYNIGAVSKFEVLSGGSANSNYRIDTRDNTYVLTVCEYKSPEETAELARLLAHLEANGFSTTRIVPTNQGKHLSTYNEKSVLLKHFLHGEMIQSLDGGLLFKTGASMARLHAITIPDSLRNQFSYGIETLDLPDEMATHPFSIWLAWVKIYIEQNISPDLRKGLIHGDIFFNNIVISPDREPVIMDFEEAGDYYRIFDLGMAIAGLCWEHGNVNHAKIKPLVDGYQSIDPLNEIETNTLKSFIVYAAAVTACWRFRQFNLTTPNEKLKDRYLEMQQLADQVWGIPDCEFVAHFK